MAPVVEHVADQLFRGAGLEPRRARKHLRHQPRLRCEISNFAERGVAIACDGDRSRAFVRACSRALMVYGVYPLAAIPTTTSCSPGLRAAISLRPSSAESSLASAAFVSALSPPAITNCTFFALTPKVGGDLRCIQRPDAAAGTATDINQPAALGQPLRHQVHGLAISGSTL